MTLRRRPKILPLKCCGIYAYTDQNWSWLYLDTFCLVMLLIDNSGSRSINMSEKFLWYWSSRQTDYSISSDVWCRCLKINQYYLLCESLPFGFGIVQKAYFTLCSKNQFNWKEISFNLKIGIQRHVLTDRHSANATTEPPITQEYYFLSNIL